MLPVGDGLSQVDAFSDGGVCESSGGFDGIDHPRPRGQLNHGGFLDLPNTCTVMGELESPAGPAGPEAFEVGPVPPVAVPACGSADDTSESRAESVASAAATTAESGSEPPGSKDSAEIPHTTNSTAMSTTIAGREKNVLTATGSRCCGPPVSAVGIEAVSVPSGSCGSSARSATPSKSADNRSVAC